MLNEATSDPDTALEADIQRRLEDSSDDRIVIAHRLSTVHNADRIHAMEDGRITESGPHEEVVEAVEAEGTYAVLYGTQ